MRCIEREIPVETAVSTKMLLVRFGDDLLSHVLGRSTISAVALNCRVRDGIGCFAHAMITKPNKQHPKRRSQAIIVVPSRIHLCVYVILTLSPVITGSSQAYRAISTSQLNGSHRLHLWPIDEVVYLGSQGYLVLRGASRLDAFSGYPVRS